MAGLNRTQILSKLPKSMLKQCEGLAWDGRVNSKAVLAPRKSQNLDVCH